ncbi:hypothetical protein [Bradyrhizobium lablabi]|uniref:hypothetical protein n=1 Tax=Bradyrhizobium lablabi TaxID=722472 RepID=UPI00090C6CB4|nr:hypothetical protein [Bradyrhizobium lablabi]SHM40863.1 hypothetical protein SAMN05444321_6245 [Bradyrhizobium lablabi]
MALLKQTPLDERINTFRAELDAFIDSKVQELKKTCPGVPDGVLRAGLTRTDCACEAVLSIKRQENAS